MAKKSDLVGFAVPISIYLYICILSAFMISPRRFLASSKARLLFPTPVGPRITITSQFPAKWQISIKLSATRLAPPTNRPSTLLSPK